MMRDNVGEVVKGQVKKDFVSFLDLRFYCEIYKEPLKDFKQEYHDDIYVFGKIMAGEWQMDGRE